LDELISCSIAHASIAPCVLSSDVACRLCLLSYLVLLVSYGRRNRLADNSVARPLQPSFSRRRWIVNLLFINRNSYIRRCDRCKDLQSTWLARHPLSP